MVVGLALKVHLNCSCYVMPSACKDNYSDGWLRLVHCFIHSNGGWSILCFFFVTNYINFLSVFASPEMAFLNSRGFLMNFRESQVQGEDVMKIFFPEDDNDIIPAMLCVAQRHSSVVYRYSPIT